MGFLDKLREGADQAKELAGQAVDRAKEEAKELQLKRQISAAEGELGRLAFALVDQGAISHPSLSGPAERIRALRGELTELQARQGSGGDTEAVGGGEAPAHAEEAQPPGA